VGASAPAAFTLHRLRGLQVLSFPKPTGAPIVKLYPGEPIDAALRRFKKAMESSGVRADIARHEHAMTRSQRRRRKTALARRRGDDK
jgi:small subunit ribosomal protein S21